MIRTRVSRLVSESRRCPVPVVDEAHLPRTEVIEELRLLTNFEMDADSWLCLHFCRPHHPVPPSRTGGVRLADQRLAMQHYPNGLGRSETAPYLEGRLNLAGAPADLPLFEPAAIEAMYLSSNGIPRLINRIAHYAPIAAYGENLRLANADHVARAAAETAVRVPER